MAGMGGGNRLVQAEFRTRNDDGVESLSAFAGGATSKANDNTNWDQVIGEAFRLRILTTRVSVATSFIANQMLQYSLNGAPWVQVTAVSSVARLKLTTWYVNQANSTDFAGRLGTGNWFTANTAAIESDVGVIGNAYTHFEAGLSVQAEFEAEWCMELVSGDVTFGDEVEFRMLGEFGGIYSDGYTFTPKATVVANPPSITNTPAVTDPAGVDYAETMTADGLIPITWELTVAPPGATIGSSDGVIAWVPSAGKVGTVYDFTVVATNADGTDTLSWAVIVRPPQLTAQLRVEPALKARSEVKPTQTLASRVEPALTGTTKVEIS